MASETKDIAAVEPPADLSLAVSRQEPDFKQFGGSNIPTFNAHLIARTSETAFFPPAPEGKQEERDDEVNGAVGVALVAFQPQDEIEGMLAAQAVALHHGTMECLRRAMLPQQPFEVASRLRKDGVNMARAMTDMLAALDRKRGKGSQHIRVERVVVNEGGQAIVGNVQNG